MTTVLAFIVTLGILIVVHEYGHYRVAIACGVKVLRFSVGFGRVIWRRQRSADATEFVVCALPLGGYVKMLDEREAPVDRHELDRAFNRKPLRQRAAIVVAGPLANLLLAVLLYSVVHWAGVEEPRPVIASPVAGSLAEAAGLRAGDWVRAISRDGSEWQEIASMPELRWQLTQAALHGDVLQLQLTDREGHGARTARLDLSSLQAREFDAALQQRIGFGAAFSEARVGTVSPGGPAQAGGLRQGDRVLEVDGLAIADAQQLVERIRAAVNGTPMHWRVERDGRVTELDITPKLVTDGQQRFGRIEAIVGALPAMTTVRYGPFDGLVKGFNRTWEMSALTLKMLGRMVIGQASLKNLSGPLTIADFAGQAVQQGLTYYLGFLAVVSVSLGVLNLLPVPLLDGGHLMYYIFEAVTGRPLSELWLERLQRGGIALLLAMMSVALFNDAVRLNWFRLLGLH